MGRIWVMPKQAEECVPSRLMCSIRRPTHAAAELNKVLLSVESSQKLIVIEWIYHIQRLVASEFIPLLCGPQLLLSDVDKELQTYKRNEQMQLNVYSWVTLFSFQMQSKLSVSLKLDGGFSEVETTIVSSLLFIFPNQYHALRLAFQHCLAFHIGLEHSWQQLSSSLSPPFYSLLPSSSLILTEEKDTFRFYLKILHFQVFCLSFTVLSRLHL